VKLLSERLQWMYDNDYMDWDVVSDAIQLAKRYEDAPVGTLEDVVDTISYVKWGFSSGDSFPGAPRLRTMDGQRVRILLDTDPNPTSEGGG
jgi:hypothetical protein